MQLIVDILIIVVKLLIAIGDAVLLLCGVLKKLLQASHKVILKTVRKTKTTIAHAWKKLPQKFARLDLGRSVSKRAVGLTHLISRLDLAKRVGRLAHLVSTRVVNPLSARLLHLSLSKPRFPRPSFAAQRAAVQKDKKIRSARRLRKKTASAFSLPFFVKIRYFLAGVVLSFLFLFLPLLVVVFVQELPSPQELTNGHIAQTTKIYDRHGTLLYQIYADQNRTVVPLTSIPKTLQQATIAIEDKDFYKHPGFDSAAIIRSLVGNISGGTLQGGSTITQQLIKSRLLSPETSIKRKVKEVILAFWSERIYTKDQILEMYFNSVPYGGTAWGIEAASQVYFGKGTKEVTLAEAAFLAGIPQAPTIYSPHGLTPNSWKKRQHEVLNRMVELDYISSRQAEDAKGQELTFKQPRVPIRSPYFVMYVKDFLVKKYGLPLVEKGGLTVVTSLDLKLQDQAEKIVREEVEKNAYLHLTNGAAVVTNPANGDILAMVGGKDFDAPDSGNVNLATSLRQPGSSIKVVTYSAALSLGLTAATMIDDSPITFPGIPPYSPVNYDGKFHGRIPLRLALGNSFNIPAVKVLNQIGIDSMVNLGKNMGIRSWNTPDKYGLSITLGSAETTMVDMATVYGTLANGGRRVNLNPVGKITTDKGLVLEEKTADVTGVRVLDEGIAFIINHILADNSARAMAFGTNSPLNIPGRTVSVKTGTSDNKRDNWTIGYTKDTLVTVWVGNNDNSPMSQQLASGITGAAPIWTRLINLLLQGKPDQKLIAPENVVQKSCYGRLEYFLKGTENSVNCSFIPTPVISPKTN